MPRPLKRVVVGFASRLRACIKARGHSSPTEFARSLDMNPRRMTNWCNTYSEPDLWHLRELAMMLDVTVEGLLGMAALPDEVEVLVE